MKKQILSIIGTIKGNIMGTTSFYMKMPNMRKEQDFIVYPIASGDNATELLIQSDTRIGRLTVENGKGKMSQSHQGGAYNHNLSMDKLVDFEISSVDLQRLTEFIKSTASKKAGKSGVMFTDNENAGLIKIV